MPRWDAMGLEAEVSALPCDCLGMHIGLVLIGSKLEGEKLGNLTVTDEAWPLWVDCYKVIAQLSGF